MAIKPIPETYSSDSGLTPDQFNVLRSSVGGTGKDAVTSYDDVTKQAIKPYLPAPTPASATPPSYARSYSTPPADETQTPDQLQSTARDMAMKDVQSRIDEVTGRYATKLNTELGATDELNKKAEARTSALSALMGLTGSSAAESRQGAAETYSAKNTEATRAKVEAQKGAELTSIYNSVDQNAAAYFKALSDTNEATRKTSLENIANNTVGYLQNLASSYKGVTFDEFMAAHENDKEVQANVKAAIDSGKSMYDLRNAWTQAIPEAFRPIVTEHPVQDPKTGNAVLVRTEINRTNPAKNITTQVDTGIPYGAYIGANIVDIGNGQKAILNKNGSWEIIKAASPEWKQTGQDEWGNPKYGWVTPPTIGGTGPAIGTTPAPATGTPGAAPAGGQAPAEQGTLYSEFLKDKTPEVQQIFNSLPDEQAKTGVIGLLQGDVLLSDLAKGGMRGSQVANTLFKYAKQIDPSFSESTNKQRYAFKVKWNDTNGKVNQTIAGVNTALYHLSRLKELTDQLGSNGDFQKANSLKNWIAANVNTPDLADTLGQFRDTVQLLAMEIARAYKGGVPDRNEIEEQVNSINDMKPTNVLNAIINNKVSLITGLLAAQAQQYKKVMGEYPAAIVNNDTLQALKSAGVDTAPVEKKLTATSNAPLPDKVKALGYDYDKLKADGYSDEEIQKAAGL